MTSAPDAVLPDSEAAVVEALREAAGPFRILGGGTRTGGHEDGCAVLSTAGLGGVRLYEPGALTLVVGAGTAMAEVEAVLAKGRQRLPFEPMDHRSLLGTAGAPTIGGAVATNASGPRRVQAGACRDSLIGVRFVDGTGSAIKSGGRVMKNVTGYDLCKLMAGSHGTLGVMTEVAFKVLPAPAGAATLTLRDLDVAEAVAAMSAAMGSTCDVSGAAHVPDRGETWLRIEGTAASVAHRAGVLRDAVARFGTATVEDDPAAVADRWRRVRDVDFDGFADGDVWRISVRPSHAPQVVAALGASTVALDWSGGLIWACTASGTDARAALGGSPGHATLMRADPATMARLGRFHPEPAPVAALSAGLHARFDPRGLFGPGRMP